MNPRVAQVEPLANFILKIKFTDNSIRQFDMKPYLAYPVFEALKEDDTFKKASVLARYTKPSPE